MTTKLLDKHRQTNINATESAMREVEYRLNDPAGREAYAASRSYYERLLEEMKTELDKLTRARS